MSSFLYPFPSFAVTMASPSETAVMRRVMAPVRGISLPSASCSALKESLRSAAAKETKGADMLVPDVLSPLVV